MLLTAKLCQAEQSTQGFEFRNEMCCISKSWASHCRSPYVRVSRSPWSQSKGGRSPLLLPSSSKASEGKSPWSGDSAAAMRALLLQKVHPMPEALVATMSEVQQHTC